MTVEAAVKVRRHLYTAVLNWPKGGQNRAILSEGRYASYNKRAGVLRVCK